MAKPETKTDAVPAKTVTKAGVLHFVYDRSTKGAHRYMECYGDGPKLGQPIDDGTEKIGQLYVRKLCLGAEPPKMLTMPGIEATAENAPVNMGK